MGYVGIRNLMLRSFKSRLKQGLLEPWIADYIRQVFVTEQDRWERARKAGKDGTLSKERVHSDITRATNTLGYIGGLLMAAAGAMRFSEADSAAMKDTFTKRVTS